MIFLIAHAQVYRAFCSRREQNGGAAAPKLRYPLGTPGAAGRTEQIKRLLGDDGATGEYEILGLLFADDATLFESLTEAEHGGIIRKTGYAEGTPISKAFAGINNKFGQRENESKGVIEPLVDTRTGNLGAQTDKRDGIAKRISKGRSQHHVLNSKVAGLGKTRQEKAQVVVSLARPSMMYGLQTRGVSQAEMGKLQKTEDAIARKSMGIEKWAMEWQGKNMRDIRREAKMVPITVEARLRQFSSHARQMRRGPGSLARNALAGRFFPPRENGAPLGEHFVDARKLPRARHLHRGDRTLMQDVRAYAAKCGIPAEILPCLTPPKEERSAEQGEELQHTIEQLAREQYTREVMEDWGASKHSGYEGEERQAEEHAALEELCGKYLKGGQTSVGVDAGLNFSERAFAKGYCILCEKQHGEGTLEGHLRAAHTGKAAVPHGIEEEHMKHEKRWEARLKAEQEQAVQENANNFRGIRAASSTQKQYECLTCLRICATAQEAMLKHMERHGEEGYIKIGEIAAGPQKGMLRPGDHAWSSQQGAWFHGPDARFPEYAIPSGAVREEGHITCRECGDYAIEFRRDMPPKAKAQARRVEKMKRHEEKCKGRSEKEEKTRKGD